MSNHDVRVDCLLCGVKNSLSATQCIACGSVLYADSAESAYQAISQADSPASIAGERLKGWQQFQLSMEERRASGHSVDEFLRSAKSRIEYWEGILVGGAFVPPTAPAKNKPASGKDAHKAGASLSEAREPVPTWATALLAGLLLCLVLIGRHGLLLGQQALSTGDRAIGYGVVAICAASFLLFLVFLHTSWRSVGMRVLVKIALWAVVLAVLLN